MYKRLLKIAAIALALSLSGCGLLPDKVDETKNWSASRLYSEARDELSSGNYEKAIQHFEKLESRYPFGTYAQQAQMEIAYAHYRQGEQPEALAAVDRFIKLHPNHPNVDYMYYLRGLINFNDRVGFLDFLSKQDPSERDPKAARDAFDSFKQLAERFPNSIYAKDAISRLKYLVNAMAQYEVHVAKYYYRRGAYLAAANRAQVAVTEYRDAPAVEEALYVMVKSYDAMDLPQLRDDADRVLRTNFPNSVYFSGGPTSDKPWWQIW
ncbi:outer membrane protein assembly factor BamD [Noviherbaspirillum sp. Root189]|uniref:outer membrane protein assembly factor BamD n=1 Tax=Noviherbaspirillum sp. Root189 TaxID=1736487 RepID=UPI00070A4A49|nr:outer membrane protein assembly factor BamD [Noviherbaspirillum sp. Root189]KRB70459.1 competence protein ComL [Noviherbaspirillum sp. Root189]